MSYFPHDTMDIVQPDEPELLEETQIVGPARYPFRWSMNVIEMLLAIGSGIGAALLIADVGTPPDSDLPLDLHGWTLPAVWLLVMVFLPSVVAVLAVSKRDPSGPAAVLGASALLGVELLVQIPFVGLSWLQLIAAVLGASAAAMAVVARAAVTGHKL